MTEKNMAEVADKAVDKIAGGVEAVAKAVEKVAPRVWELLVRQTIAEGVASLALALVVGVGFVIALKYLLPVSKRRIKLNNSHKWVPCKPDDFGDYTMPAGEAVGAGVGLIIGGIVAFFYVLTQVHGGTLRLVNPEYYAAKELIEAAK